MSNRFRGFFHREPPVIIHILVRFLAIALPVAVLPDIFTADVNHYWDVGKVVGWHTLPYRDFLWEFPPLTTLILLFVPLGAHVHVAFYALVVFTMLASEIVTFLVVRHLAPATERPLAAWYWLAVFVPLSTIVYFRLDWPAAMFGAIALAGLVGYRTRSSVAGIALGFVVKVWTIVFVVPLLGLKRFKEAIAGGVVSVVLVGIWYLYSSDGLHKFLEYRKGSAFQIESIPGSLVMLLSDHHEYFGYGAVMVTDEGWGWVQPILPAIFVVVALAIIPVMWKRPLEVVSLTAGLVLLLLLTSRLLSPQYLVWMAPFLMLLVRHHRRLAFTFAIASYLTIFEIAWYHQVGDGVFFFSLVVVVRNVMLLWVLFELFRAALRPKEGIVKLQSQPQ